MDLAAARRNGASWNPLRCGGTALPVPLLLMAKCIALNLLLTNYARLLPESGLKAVFWVGAVALLWNRRVRASCLLLGGSVLVGLLVSRAGVWNIAWLCALMLLMAGCYTGAESKLYRWLVRLVPLLRWPERPLEVIYDGECGFCDWSRAVMVRLDMDHVFSWLPYQTGRGQAVSISKEQASARLHLIERGGVLSGFSAVRRMLIYLPVFWLALCVLFALAPPLFAMLWRSVVVGAALIFYSPLMNPVGNAAYDFVARHRHRIFRGRACRLPRSGRGGGGERLSGR